MTALRPETLVPIEVEGHLRLDSPTGQQVNVRAENGVFHVDVPGWPELRAMMPGSYRSRAGLVRKLADAARAGGVRISIESAGRPFLELGHGITSNFLARLIGLAPAHLRFSILRVFLRR